MVMASPSPRIESLLAARLFVAPQAIGDRLLFVSNLSGHMSLYAMDRDGSVPEPLLPPDVVLQNPHLMSGPLYYAFPRLRKVLLMLDHHGDENYLPMFVPLDGGVPEPVFADELAGTRVHMSHPDLDRDVVQFVAESRKEQMYTAYQADLGRESIEELGRSKWGCWPAGANEAHTKAILIDGYTAGDSTMYMWERGAGGRRLLYGRPLEDRAPGEVVPLNGIYGPHFVADDTKLVLVTTLFDDAGGLGVLDIDDPAEIAAVRTTGKRHSGRGEIDTFWHLEDERYAVAYNIDGCSWLYEGTLDVDATTMRLAKVLCGKGDLSDGVLESYRYDKDADRFALSFSSATSPTQIHTLEGKSRRAVRRTRERVLGIPGAWMSAGDDASFTSFDGTPIAARMYRPAKDLGFDGPRPLVYYVHGGPQSQERPDFAWFSMPLIQFLALHGFAVFVPNVRGSSGYGMAYMKQVDRDWGGKDRLDHVHAMTKVLPQDGGVDTGRAAVVGRSYGGYMSLTLAGRHPGLWTAACDMFGPYDLLTFIDRLPETWKPYFSIAVGDPTKDKELLIERSPRTYIENLACPLLVIQGKNDPRVIEQESRDLVERLRSLGKNVEYLMFEDEGHDVLKFANRVTCYNAITTFFEKHLRP